MSDGFKKVLILLGIVIYTVGPLLLTVIAGGAAEALGCSLTEARVSECVLAGVDIGDILYLMALTHWFAIFTLPTGALALAAYMIYLLVSPVVSRSENKESKRASIAVGWLLALVIGSLLLWGYQSLQYDELGLDSFRNKSDAKFIKACAKGSPGKIEKYLEGGADPNLDGPRGMNPLLAAYIGRNLDGFYLLLENGADPNFIPHTGMDEHVAAYIMGSGTEDWRPDGIPYVKALFEYGLDPNLGDESWRLIHFAATARRGEHLQMVVENGADINADSKWGTALALAIREPRPGNALYLVEQEGIEGLEDTVKWVKQTNRSYLDPEEKAKFHQLVSALSRRGVSVK